MFLILQIFIVIYFFNNVRDFRNIELKDELKNNNISFLGNQYNTLNDTINKEIIYKKIIKK